MAADVSNHNLRTFTVVVGNSPHVLSETPLSISLSGLSGASAATASLPAGSYISIRDVTTDANPVDVTFYWSVKCQ